MCLVLLGRSVKACGGEDALHIDIRSRGCSSFCALIAAQEILVFFYYQYCLLSNPIFRYHVNHECAWIVVSVLGWLATSTASYFLTSETLDIFLVLWWTTVFIGELGGYAVVASDTLKKFLCNTKCLCRCLSRYKTHNGMPATSSIPLNIHLHVERLDLFIVLALGEVVAGKKKAATKCTFVFSLTKHASILCWHVCFCMQKMYRCRYCHQIRRRYISCGDYWETDSHCCICCWLKNACIWFRRASLHYNGQDWDPPALTSQLQEVRARNG